MQIPDTNWTRLNLGDDNDQVTIGNSGSLDGILGKVSVEGQAGTDSLTVDDSASTDNNTDDNGGVLTAASLTGLGMDDDEGITFGGVESMAIALGDGADHFTLLGVGVPTNVTLGDGDDTIFVSGTFRNFSEDIQVSGELGDDDLLSLTFAQATKFTLGASSVTSGSASGNSELLQPRTHHSRIE